RGYGGVVNLTTSQAARIPVDLDLDGIPEIVAGPSAYDRDGHLLWSWRGGATAPPDHQNFQIERAGPSGIYVPQFLFKVIMSDGWTAVANVDDDPYPEIIVVTEAASTGYPDGLFTQGIWVFDHDGTLHSPPAGLVGTDGHPDNYHMGPPTVADFDGDGQPEVAIEELHQVLTRPITPDNPSRPILHLYELGGTERWHRDMDPIDAPL